MPNAKVSDGSQPRLTLHLSLSESAGSGSLHRLEFLDRTAALDRGAGRPVEVEGTKAELWPARLSPNRCLAGLRSWGSAPELSPRLHGKKLSRSSRSEGEKTEVIILLDGSLFLLTARAANRFGLLLVWVK